MEKELKQIKERLIEKRESLSCNEKIRVKALEAIHPNIIISCVQSRYKVTETLSAPVIIYDAAQRKLVLG